MTPSELTNLLKVDPFQLAEDMTGKSYKDSKETEQLGFLLTLHYNQEKNKILNDLGDSYYSNTLEDYQRIIGSIGFELAGSFPFIGTSTEAPEETLFVYAHKAKGIILIFDTYGGNSVNGGQFHYCWKPNPGISNSQRWL